MSDVVDEVDVGPIFAHGNTARQEGPPADYDARLEKLELMIEQVGLTAELSVQLTEYISDLRQETASLRSIRRIVLCGAGGLVLTLLIFMAYIMLWRPILFFAFGPAARVALITSTIVGAVFLIAIVLKGVFRTIADRNAEEPMPPSLQLAIDAVKTLVRPGNS